MAWVVIDPVTFTSQAAITRHSSSSTNSLRISSTTGVWSTFRVSRVLRIDGPLTILLARPDVRFFCDLNFDPFLIMQDQKKVYGTVSFPVFLYGRRFVNSASFRFHDLSVRIRSNDSDLVGHGKRYERSFQACADLFTDEKTVYPFLWSEFTAANPGLVSPDNAMGFISDDGGVTYNRCHCEGASLIP